MKKFDFGDAMHSLYSNNSWILRGTHSLAGLEWNEPDLPRPTEAELTAECERLQVEWQRTEYQRSREQEYPPIKEQLDMLYWDRINGTDNWQSAINEIKNKYPKPTE